MHILDVENQLLKLPSHKAKNKKRVENEESMKQKREIPQSKTLALQKDY